jgi:hypothetical protein
MVLRISSSRPITGSNFPSLANFVKSRVYFSRNWPGGTSTFQFTNKQTNKQTNKNTVRNKRQIQSIDVYLLVDQPKVLEEESDHCLVKDWILVEWFLKSVWLSKNVTTKKTIKMITYVLNESNSFLWAVWHVLHALCIFVERIFAWIQICKMSSLLKLNVAWNLLDMIETISVNFLKEYEFQ